LEDFNNGGLLGEMCIVHVSYSGKTDAPIKMMAKFRPPDFETRVTTALFDICEHEFDFYRSVQPILAEKGIRCPKMVFGDFSRRSASFIFLLEFVDAKFHRIQSDDCVSEGRDEMIFLQLAKLHATFWGGKDKSIEFIPPVNDGPNKVIPSVARKHLKTFYSDLCAQESNKASPEMQAMIAEMCGPQLLKLLDHFANSEWLTMFHGDPRADNWFFEETNGSEVKRSPTSTNRNIGVLDWQLMNKGFAGIDLSWVFSTTIDLGTDEQQVRGKELVRIYYAELVRLGTINPDTMKLDAFEQELALAHLYSMAKVIIGAGGLDKNDANTIEVMTFLCRRCLQAMQAHGTLEAFTAFKEGKLLSQQTKSAAVDTGAIQAGPGINAARPTI